MGAWGVDAFDNDEAADWAWGLEGNTDLAYVEAALDNVLAVGRDYLESDVACEAVAAAETIARLQGNGGPQNEYTKPMDDWAREAGLKPPAALAAKARQVLLRIQQEPSELLELWEESDDGGAWKNAVADLISRIK